MNDKVKVTEFLRAVGRWHRAQPFRKESWNEVRSALVSVLEKNNYKATDYIYISVIGNVLSDARYRLSYDLPDAYEVKALLLPTPKPVPVTPSPSEAEALGLTLFLNTVPAMEDAGVAREEVERVEKLIRLLVRKQNTVTPTLVLDGANEGERLFGKYIGLYATDLPHNPFITFTTVGSEIRNRIVYNIVELLEMPDETQVLVQWPGQHRSDFFNFTVQEARSYVQRYAIVLPVI